MQHRCVNGAVGFVLKIVRLLCRGHFRDTAGIQEQHRQHSVFGSDVVRRGKGRIAQSILIGSDAAVGTLRDCLPDVGYSVELNDADFYHFRAREPVFPVLGRGGD